MKRLTFSKKDRLKHTKSINKLFTEGQSLHVYPIRIVYRWIDEEVTDSKPAIKCTVSVPSRSFRKASARNYLKRRIREAYRLQREILLPFTSSDTLHLILIYTAKEKLSYQTISASLKKGLTRLVQLKRKEV